MVTQFGLSVSSAALQLHPLRRTSNTLKTSNCAHHISCSSCEWCTMYESKSKPAPAHSPLKEPYTSVLSSSGLPQF